MTCQDTDEISEDGHMAGKLQDASPPQKTKGGKRPSPQAASDPVEMNLLRKLIVLEYVNSLRRETCQQGGD